MTGNKFTKDDVWGEFDLKNMKRVHEGMIIARGGTSSSDPVYCPHWGDLLGYKDTTFKVDNRDDVEDVCEWLYYVHGAGCITNLEVCGDGATFIRSEYQCW